MASNTVMIHKLQQALNMKGQKLLYSTSQFYSEQQNRPVTMYHIKQAIFDEETGKNRNIELFKSVSQIQVVLFLRDMWHEVNGWEVPNDNPIWNSKKEDRNNGQ
jgi:hypothetical protein